MTETQRIKIPTRSTWSRVEKALTKTPHDNQWHKILEMGLSSAEQTARSYNVEGGNWTLGYTHGTNTQGEVCSYLWAKHAP